MKRHGNNELAVKNFTTIANKGKRRIENDTEEAIPTTVHDARTPRTLATGRQRLRHRYRQTGRFATTPSMSANACQPMREGHVKALQECGVQPLTQDSTVLSCLVLYVYWPTLLVESNGQGWVRMLLGC